MRTVNTFTSAVSMTPSSSRPARTASRTLAVVISSPLQLRSLPDLRAMAWPPAGARTSSPVLPLIHSGLPCEPLVVKGAGAQLCPSSGSL
ncbi:hypothetical protein CF54_18250 [Streptomyces sp. Tu 6176]|nr:hypothetical protein CF54_18250 [Streptomyces sp. Tu 6176]